MSLHDYQVSQEISAQDYLFYALLMACFRKADTDNRRKLQRAFPFRFQEFLLRYHAPGGLLEGERFVHPLEKYFGPPDGYFRKGDEKAWSSEGEKDERRQNMRKVYDHMYGPEKEE